MSDELKAFYIALYQWLTKSSYAKRRNQYDFSVVAGICGNLNKYCESLGISDHIHKSLIQELQKSFKDAGLDDNYPFNDGSYISYRDEYSKYDNTDRFNWIKKHI